jgi:hypothetical protein
MENFGVYSRFQPLTEELEERAKKAITAFKDNDVTDVQMVTFFFKYFFTRLEPLYKMYPKQAGQVRNTVKDLVFGVRVPKAVNVTVSVKNINEITVVKDTSPKNPVILFDSVKTVELITLAKYSMIQAFLDKKLQVKKLVKILKWLAPIIGLLTHETIKAIRADDLVLIDRLLQEMGY